MPDIELVAYDKDGEVVDEVVIGFSNSAVNIGSCVLEFVSRNSKCKMEISRVVRPQPSGA